MESNGMIQPSFPTSSKFAHKLQTAKWSLKYNASFIFHLHNNANQLNFAPLQLRSINIRTCSHSALNVLKQLMTCQLPRYLEASWRMLLSEQFNWPARDPDLINVKAHGSLSSWWAFILLFFSMIKIKTISNDGHPITYLLNSHMDLHANIPGKQDTSHTRLRAHDQCTSSTLISGKGRASPSSLHTTFEGPTE